MMRIFLITLGAPFCALFWYLQGWQIWRHIVGLFG